jgi:hypothetical protein
MEINTGILAYSSDLILYSNREKVYLKTSSRPKDYLIHLEFIKGLTEKEFFNYAFKIFEYLKDDDQIMVYLEEEKITFLESQMSEVIFYCAANKRFNLAHRICKLYSFKPKENYILREYYRKGSPHDVDYIQTIGGFNREYETLLLHLEECVTYGNLELLKYKLKSSDYGKEELNRLIIKSQNLEVYEYLLKQGADKIMIDKIGHSVDINFIKYLYNSGFTFKKSHLLDIFQNKRCIEMLDFLISKGHEFKELKRRIREDDIFRWRGVIYLLKLGYAKERYFDKVDSYYFLVNEATLDDLEFIRDLNIKDMYNEIVGGKYTDIVKCYIYFNREKFNRWPKVIEECSNFYKNLQIKKYLTYI